MAPSKTYSNRKESGADDQSVQGGDTSSQRVANTLMSVSSRLKRLSITVADAKSCLKTGKMLRKKSFITNNGRSDIDIDICDLERLQTQAGAGFTDWYTVKLAEGWSFEKLAESTFSEVFLAKSAASSMVVKVMPLEDEESGKPDSEQSPVPVPLAAAYHEISALLAIKNQIQVANRYAVPSGWTGFANLLEYH